MRNDLNRPSVSLIKLNSAPELSLTPGHWLVRTLIDKIDRYVDKVDIPTRMLSVRYENKRGKIISENISYDEDGLVWFQEKESELQSESDDPESFAVVLDKIPPMDKVAGLWICRANSQENGLVDKINMITKTMTVLYEGENDTLISKEVFYDEPGLVWMK